MKKTIIIFLCTILLPSVCFAGFRGYLKQSTAVTITIGPMLDDSDGNTTEDSLTISQADVRLKKNSGDFGQKNESSSCTHDELGEYDCDFDATDTNTLGRLRVVVHESGALIIDDTYIVLAAAVFDSLIGATDYLPVDAVQVEGSDATDQMDAHDGDPAQAGDEMNLADDAITSAKYDESTAFPVVSADSGSTAIARTGADGDTLETLSDQVDGPVPANVTQIGGDAQSLADLKDFADAGYDPSTDKVQGVVLVDTTNTNTDMRGTDNALPASSAPANFGDLAITETTGLVSVGTNNDKTGYTASTVSDKTGYSLAADQSGVTIGTCTTNTDMVSEPPTVTEIWQANISAYSGEGYAGTYLKNLYDNQGNWLTATGFMLDTEDGSSFSAIPDMATATNQTTIAGYVDDLETRLGTPSDLGGGATVADNLADIEGQTDDIGAAGVGLTEAGGDGDHLTAIDLPNQTMDITGSVTGNLSGSVGSVTGAVGSVTGAVGSVTGNVGGNVTGTIGGLTAAALADFFDTDSGTTYAAAVAGSAVKEIADNAGGSALTEAGIADAVWDEAQADHVGAGTFGVIASEIADVLVDTAEIGAAGAGLTAVPWNAAWDAEVQSEVADVLKTDTISEQAQGIPPTTPTFEEAIMYLYMALTKSIDIDATLKEFYNNSGTVIWKKSLSDDGTNYTESKGASGP